MMMGKRRKRITLMAIKGHGYCIIMYYNCTDFNDAEDGGGGQKLRQNSGNNTNDGGGRLRQNSSNNTNDGGGRLRQNSSNNTNDGGGRLRQNSSNNTNDGMMEEED